jgi:predicted metalloendopeptidase
MPDRSYYLDDTPTMARHRKSYTTMVHNIMVLCGRSKVSELEVVVVGSR